MSIEHDDDEAAWEHYADLEDDIAIPTIGVRVLAYVNTDGKRSVTYALDVDDEQVYLLIGVLEQVKRDLLDLVDGGGDEQ